jgi:hypothetical protein
MIIKYNALRQTGEAAPSESETELKELAASLKDTQPIGALVALARTIDQVRACIIYLSITPPITTPLYTHPHPTPDPHTQTHARKHTRKHTRARAPACASMRGRAMLDPVTHSTSKTVDQTPPLMRGREPAPSRCGRMPLRQPLGAGLVNWLYTCILKIL